MDGPPRSALEDDGLDAEYRPPRGDVGHVAPRDRLAATKTEHIDTAISNHEVRPIPNDPRPHCACPEQQDRSCAVGDQRNRDGRGHATPSEIEARPSDNEGSNDHSRQDREAHQYDGARERAQPQLHVEARMRTRRDWSDRMRSVSIMGATSVQCRTTQFGQHVAVARTRLVERALCDG
jgi:hypothetical protein